MDSYNSHFLSQQMSQTISPNNDNSCPSFGTHNKGQREKMVEPTVKANWDTRNTDVFIRLCAQEVTKGNRPGTHFNKKGWHLVRNFALATNRKYYVADAGYPNMSGFLSPYKGEKYHLPDFQRASAYNNHYEMFNQLHSSLRSTIERSFGCWKNRFYMLNDIPVNLPWEDQVALVPATMAIHNFIRKVDKLDEEFLRYDRDPEYIPDDIVEECRVANRHGQEVTVANGGMDRLRDEICASISFSRVGFSNLELRVFCALND